MRRFLLSSIGLGLILGLSAGASAQDEAARAQAREHFQSGVARFEAEDFQGALEQFQEAYRIAPHPSVRVNMANCYERLDRPLEALHHFQGFLAESENPSPQQRREVQAAMRRLRGQLGELRLTIAPDGALVTIDGTETRRAPVLEAIMLGRGTHTIEVRLDGFETAREEVTIAGGDTQRLTVRLERPAPDDPAVASTDPDPIDDGGEDTTPPDDTVGETSDTSADVVDPDPIVTDDGGWSFQLTAPVLIAGITTAVFGVAAIITGVLALDFNDQYEDAGLRYDGATSDAERAMARADGLSAADNANTTSILTDVFLIGTIAAAGATIFFVIVDGLGGDDSETASRERPLAVSGAVTDQSGAVTLLGRF